MTREEDAARYGADLDTLYEQQLQAGARCQAGARLCKPTVRIKPSGRRLFHSDSCPAKPGQPIYANEYVGSSWRNPTPWRGR